MTGAPNVTPNEIRNAKFASSLRGFKREDVEEFLNHAADALEDALSIAADYQQRYNHLRQKHEKLSSMERTLKTTLLEAKKSGESLIESARADADDIITKAQHQQREIENSAKERVNQMQKRIEKLSQMRDDYQESLVEALSEHLRAIKEMRVEAPEVGGVENPVAEKKDDEIIGVVEYETGSVPDTEQNTDHDNKQALESASGANAQEDDEVTKTWKTIQETDTDGPALSASLVESTSQTTSSENGETHTDSNTRESSKPTMSLDHRPEGAGKNQTETADATVQANHTPPDPKKVSQSEKDQGTVVDQIARAVRSARSTADAGVDSQQHAKPDAAPDFLDEDTLYKRLATEHKSKHPDPPALDSKPTEHTTDSPKASASAKKVTPELPGPGPDGIMVFGRKEDRERSVEENVKVLQELDTVIDRFTEELEDIQRK